MKSHHLKLIRALIALSCTCAVSITPIIPQFHQTYAKHRHVFCADHLRIEDSGDKRETPLLSEPAGPNDARQRSFHAGLPDDASARLECYCSNSFVHLSADSSSDNCTQQDVEVCPVNCTGLVGIKSVAIILFAPKHSPPLTRAS